MKINFKLYFQKKQEMQRSTETITPNTIMLVLLLNENIEIKDINLYNQINKYIIERILVLSIMLATYPNF